MIFCSKWLCVCQLYYSSALLYSNNFTSFSPRPRLTNNAETGDSDDMMLGDIGSPEETHIAEKYDSPVIIHRFPSKSNAFYMKSEFHL